MTPKPRHPIQPVEPDARGTLRFRPNILVCYLLDNGGIGLNDLAAVPGIPREDWEQLAQLIGYSLGGFEELSYVSAETLGTAKRMAESGVTEEQARIEYLEAELAAIRDGLREPVARLFGLRPDDLGDEP